MNNEIETLSFEEIENVAGGFFSDDCSIWGERPWTVVETE